jgi:hypothetical protein
MCEGAYASDAVVEFDRIKADTKKLQLENSCFQIESPDLTYKCWSRNPDDAEHARNSTRILLHDLSEIQDTYPIRSVVLQAKLHLLTHAGMLCEEANLPQDEVDTLKTMPSTFREWTESLGVCARESADEDMYNKLRGAIGAKIHRFSQPDRVALLHTWFDSFLDQYSPPGQGSRGDLMKVAPRVEKADIDAWKLFAKALLHEAGRPHGFPASSVSMKEMDAAKKALNSI